jgi:hypothetical protein
MKVRSTCKSEVASFKSIKFYKCGFGKGLFGLFGDINILLQAANNPEMIRRPD